MFDYNKRLNRALEFFDECTHILILGGPGLGYEVGLFTYGADMDPDLHPYMAKYLLFNIENGFQVLPDPALPAFYAKYRKVFYDNIPDSKVHADLFDLVRRKHYFVMQCNPDRTFEKAKFPPENIFYMAGDAHLLQCANACCSKVFEMPSAEELLSGTPLPVCPECGGKTRINLDTFPDKNFVPSPTFTEQIQKHHSFVRRARKRKLLILELGCSIRNHFGLCAMQISEYLARRFPGVRVIRINRHEALSFERTSEQTVLFDEPIARVVADMLSARPAPKRGRPKAPTPTIRPRQK